MLKTSFREGKKPIRLIRNLNWGLSIPFAFKWATSREHHTEPAEDMLLQNKLFTKVEAQMKISFVLKWKWNVQLQACSFFPQRSPRTQQVTLHGIVVPKSSLGVGSVFTLMQSVLLAWKANAVFLELKGEEIFSWSCNWSVLSLCWIQVKGLYQALAGWVLKSHK